MSRFDILEWDSVLVVVLLVILFQNRLYKSVRLVNASSGLAPVCVMI